MLAALLCLGKPPTIAQDNYLPDIQAWRAEREAALKADDGWLTVAGLFFLHEGDNSFGNGPLNDIVLPEGPEHAGSFRLRGQEVQVSAAPGQTLSVDGEDVSHAQLYPREDRVDLTIGSLTLFVHLSGERLAIRMRDQNSEIRRSFVGLRWYPIDESYRIRGRFVSHDEPMTVRIQNILGDVETHTSNGSVTLLVQGQELRLLPLAAGDQLWFIFRDLTSGLETYPAARFLYADAPRNGWTVLDFNKAYNPPCAFNPYTTCPLPPLDNRLPVRIEAGELAYQAGN